MDPTLLQLYDCFTGCRKVCTDSRNVIPGSIFFALKGATFNGNLFADQAISEGASWAVVDDPACAGNEKCILVPDGLKALQDLARYHRSRFNIPVVGVTGSNGKTTTKELIHAVLSSAFRVVSTQGNLNNHIGVPLTLLDIDDSTEIAVVEMGANHPGEIDALCHIADPGFGIITNIGKAHLEGFGGFEGVVQTKTELYRYLAKKNGLLFVNGSDDLLCQLSEGLRQCTYGPAGSDASLDELTAGPEVGVTITLAGSGKLAIKTRIYGQYNVPNILAAACIGNYFKVSPGNIRGALENYLPSNNRSQVRKTERNLLILDAYNANPGSMKAALEAFAATKHNNKTVILGDMLELGETSDQEHQAILDLITDLGFNRVYLVGPRFTRLNDRRENTCFEDVALAKLWFTHQHPDNETILLKGSRGIRLEMLADVL